MPHWGRPPGGPSGVGRYYEGVDDVLRFQELGSDDEKNGRQVGRRGRRVLDTTGLSQDELYFNDMDVRAWERRASAYDEPYPGFADVDEGYYEDLGEVLSPEDYEEMLFQRVLDKIRIARAAGNEDVQLSTEELDAYQSKLHGARTPAARPPPVSRPTDAYLNDTASIANAQTKHVHSSSRPKKEKERTSRLGSKSKKDKDKSSHRKRVSNSSSITSPIPGQSSPGFMIPGPDGQPVFAPINAYQGNVSRDSIPSPREQLASSRTTSRSTSGNLPPQPAHQPMPPREVLGAFPGSEHTYRPPTPSQHEASFQPQNPNIPSLSARQQAYARERQLEAQGLLSTNAQQQAARAVPFPVEMYQYQAFSPAPTSPTSSHTQTPSQSQSQYIRRVSSGALSDASYSSMPRRVPVPTSSPTSASTSAPMALQRSAMASSSGFVTSGGETGEWGLGVEVPSGGDVGAAGVRTMAAATATATATASGSVGSGAKDGERRRKSGKAKKKA